MFAEAFHSTIKVIHPALEVKTSFGNSTPVTGSSMNLALRSLDFPLTVVNDFSGGIEGEEPTYKKLQSKACTTTLSKTDQSSPSGHTSRHVKASSGKGYITL
jgi:hypothetical protein